MNAEVIILDGATLTTLGNVVLNASDSVSGGIASGRTRTASSPS